jgi:hypothetical protein
LVIHHSAYFPDRDDGPDKLWSSLLGIGAIHGLAGIGIFGYHLACCKNLPHWDFDAWYQAFLQGALEVASQQLLMPIFGTFFVREFFPEEDDFPRKPYFFGDRDTFISFL